MKELSQLKKRQIIPINITGDLQFLLKWPDGLLVVILSHSPGRGNLQQI